LAWALIGGLISSMFLTLVVVPVIYYIFDRILHKLGLGKQKQIVIDAVDNVKIIPHSTREIINESVLETTNNFN